MDDSNFHSSAEPHITSTDGADNMNVTEAEKTEHAQKLEKMAEGTTPEDRDRQKLPPSILKLYEDAYPVVREHWWEDGSDGHNEQITEINAKIEELRVPSSEIRTTIDAFRKCFKELEECPEQDHAKAKRIVESARLIANDQIRRLEVLGIPWRLQAGPTERGVKTRFI